MRWDTHMVSIATLMLHEGASSLDAPFFAPWLISWHLFRAVAIGHDGH